MKIKCANCSMLIDREGTTHIWQQISNGIIIFAFLEKDGGKVELVRKMIQHEILEDFFPLTTSTV